MTNNNRVKALIDGLFLSKRKQKKAEKEARNTPVTISDMKEAMHAFGQYGANDIFDFDNWQVEDSTVLREYSNNDRKIKYRNKEGTGRIIARDLFLDQPYEYFSYRANSAHLSFRTSPPSLSEQEQLLGFTFIYRFIEKIERELQEYIHPINIYSYSQLREAMDRIALKVLETERSNIEDEITGLMRMSFDRAGTAHGIEASRIDELQTTQRLLTKIITDVTKRSVGISRIFPIGVFPLGDAVSVDPGSLPFTLIMGSPGLSNSVREFRKYIDERLRYRVQNPLIRTSLKIDV